MRLRELCPELAKKAKEELNEVPSRIPQDLQAIKDWLAKQPHITARTDDQWLIAFLRGCKYSLERTKEKLDMFYTIKSAIPEICMSMDPMDPKVQEILSSGIILPLPSSDDPAGPRYSIGRFKQLASENITLFDVARTSFMIFTLQLLEDDNFVIAGQVDITDWSDVTMKFITQMTPTIMKKFVIAGQDAVPVRKKASHNIYVPSIAETIFSIGKPFLNEKNRSRLFVHKDIEELQKYVPKSVLPTEYGGDAGSIQDIVDYWKKKMEDNRDLFIEDRNFKTDESKRPGKPKTAETLFGIEGSFRQLTVD